MIEKKKVFPTIIILLALAAVVCDSPNSQNPDATPSGIRFSGTMRDTASIGALYCDTIRASASDSSPLVFQLFQPPAGMVLSDSVIAWIPGSGDTGVLHMAVVAKGNSGQQDTLNWTITVAAQKGFLRIQFESLVPRETITYTGTPVLVSAFLDSAVLLSELLWHTGYGIQQRCGSLSKSSLGSEDSVWLHWEKLPSTGQSSQLPADTIWAEYRGSMSNKLIVNVSNLPPKLDSMIVNQRAMDVSLDSLTIPANHGETVSITVHSHDRDTGGTLSIQWTTAPAAGQTFPVQTVGPGVFILQWQVPAISDVGDTTAVLKAILRLSDGTGGNHDMPLRLLVYREAGTVWYASTNQAGSFLVKCSADGRELLRIGGFEEIAGMAINPRSELIWLTDRKSNKVHCFDGDGVSRHMLTGFLAPQAIDVHGVYGYACVADRDTSTLQGGRIRIVNKQGKGGIDTASGTHVINGTFLGIRLDQTALFEVWSLWQTVPFGGLSHYRQSLGTPTNLHGFQYPVSMDFAQTRGIAWVTDKGNNCIKKISTITDTVLASIYGFRGPSQISVCHSDNSCWIADTENNRIVKLMDGVTNGYSTVVGTAYHYSIPKAFGIPFKSPAALAANANEGSGVVWVADPQNQRLVKLDHNGDELLSVSDLDMGSRCLVVVNPGSP